MKSVNTLRRKTRVFVLFARNFKAVYMYIIDVLLQKDVAKHAQHANMLIM